MRETASTQPASPLVAAKLWDTADAKGKLTKAAWFFINDRSIHHHSKKD